MLSAAAAKKATESKLKIEAQRRRDKVEQEQSAKNKRRAEVIAEALKILNTTTAALISKAAHEGKNTVKLQPLEDYKLYGHLYDDAFTPFIDKLKANGYKVKVVDEMEVRKSDPDFWGYEDYSVYFEVSW